MASGGGRPPRDLRVLGRLPSGAPSPADLWPLSVAGPAQHPPTPQVSELTHCCCSVPGCLDSAWCSWPMCLHWWAAGGSPSGLGPRARGQGPRVCPLVLCSHPWDRGRLRGSSAERPGLGVGCVVCCSLSPPPPRPRDPILTRPSLETWSQNHEGAETRQGLPGARVHVCEPLWVGVKGCEPMYEHVPV